MNIGPKNVGDFEMVLLMTWEYVNVSHIKFPSIEGRVYSHPPSVQRSPHAKLKARQEGMHSLVGASDHNKAYCLSFSRPHPRSLILKPYWANMPKLRYRENTSIYVEIFANFITNSHWWKIIYPLCLHECISPCNDCIEAAKISMGIHVTKLKQTLHTMHGLHNTYRDNNTAILETLVCMAVIKDKW